MRTKGTRVATWLLCCALLAACERTATPGASGAAAGPLPTVVAGVPVSQGAAPGYVPDTACAECHAPEYQSYQAVGMARSFYPPDPAQAVETAHLGKVFTHAATGYHYVMSIQDGKYVLQRFCRDATGRRFAEHAVEVAWIVGSGNHVRSYLGRNPAGELFQLPICWYRGVGFAMSPGYDRVDHPHFERVVDRGCMFCHNAYPELPAGADLPHRSHRFPAQLPHGIGCQRCHGPGARHVQRAEDPAASDDQIRATITNPANHSTRQQEDLCMSCHLQPEAVRSRLMPRAFDRGTFSFQPGDDLTDFIKHLDHGTPAERRQRYEINHHAYRLRQSRCYQASPGRLTCLTCHDPHRKVAAADRAAHYRAKCTQCHSTPDDATHRPEAARNDCIPCHMVTARPSDVVHVTTTDHRIRRRPPAQDPAAPRREHHPPRAALTIVPYFPERIGSDPDYPLFRGFGDSYFPTAASRQAWRAAFEQSRPHPVAAFVTVGRGLLETGDLAGARELLTEAVGRFPQDAPARWSLGEVLLRAGEIPAAVAALSAAAELDRTDPGIQAALGEALARAGELPLARAAYQRALQGRPNSASTWRALGLLLVRMEDQAGALQALRTSIRWNPRDPYCYELASWILANQRRHDQQFQLLTAGAALLPEIQFALVAARFLSRSSQHRDPQAGRQLAAQLVRERPEDPRALLHQALAQVFEGRPDAATAAIAAARRRGADPASCTALAILHWHGRGDRPRVEQLRQQLEAELRDSSDEPLRGKLLSHLRGLQLR